MKLAVYNYTYSTNGIKVPNGRIVRLIDEKTIREDIEFAKSVSADFILIWFHLVLNTKPNQMRIKSSGQITLLT
jgi:hypothetical protein